MRYDDDDEDSYVTLVCDICNEELTGADEIPILTLYLEAREHVAAVHS